MSPSNLGLSLTAGLLILCLCALVGCSHKKETPQQRYDSAKALFDKTTKEFHTASAAATGADKARLQKEAVKGYEELLKKYPDQDYWAAQALRNLAAIKADEGNLREAIPLFASVEKKYPKQEWEVLMAWKTAADLLWESGDRTQAKAYYQKIVTTFDKPEAPQVVKTVVRGSKLRLADQSLPGEGTRK